MNIDKLQHHMQYNKIIDLNKDENGKINWNTILDYPDLPMSFIDCYFHQLKPFGIERRIKLNDNLIKKYGSQLNWYNLLTHQKISEENIELFSNKFISTNLWIYVFKYQDLSLNFLNAHKSMFKDKTIGDTFINALKQNLCINKNIKFLFLSNI